MIKESEYSIKSICVDAIISCVLAALSALSMIGAIVASYRYDGDGPRAVGLLGLMCLIFSACGVMFGVTAWKSPDGGLLMKRIAIIVNVLPLVAAIVFYFSGLI